MPLNDRILKFGQYSAAYVEGGEGFPVLMIHGSGPGASTMGNWRLILDPLSERYNVFAMDLIGFGRSPRKTEQPYFDPDLWLEQCQALVDIMPGDQVGVIAHSISAVLAFRLAAQEPRVAKVLTTGAMGAPFQVNEDTIACWTFPESREAMRATAERLIFDKTIIDDAYLDSRMKVLHGDPAYRAYFSEMFSGDRQHFADISVLDEDTLARITCDVTMLHGRNDTAFPPSSTLKLAEKIPQADIHMLARCSHSVAMEYPEKLLAAAYQLFGKQKTADQSPADIARFG
jgi:2-hydroxymuconate-semialdehyde hydrolase